MATTKTILSLRLVRQELLRDRTIGELFVEYSDAPGEFAFFGWVVEDLDRGLDAAMPLEEIRRRKVAGETCIPTGRFRLAWVMSPSRGRPTLRLLKVPGFDGILVHSGNTPEHTKGCVCPGLYLDVKAGRTTHSKAAVAWLEKQLQPLLEAGAEVWFSVERAYPAPEVQ